MANFYASNADGNWSTATTWGKSSSAIGTPTLHASTNITPLTTGVNSAAFTAPNITGNKSVGCVVFCATVAGSGTWTATLQEDSGGGFVNTTATATIAHAGLVANNWLYFQWGTPYAYTVATALKYRIQLKVSVANSGTVAADATAATIATIEFNDIGGPPALGDRVFISPANQSGTRTVTVTGTSNACGDNADSAANLPSQRSILNAITVGGITNSGSEGLLQWDTVANSSLTCRGYFIRNQGAEWRMGTIATPMPAGVTATLTYDCNGTDGSAGGRCMTGSRRILQGASIPNTTDWKRTYASGSGTTIDPLIISAGAAFAANDQVVISNQTYTTVEYKYIKVVNSSTSYTLSDTAGGVESGLAQTHHVTDDILNIQRNVLITSNANNQNWGDVNTTTGITIIADNQVAWCNFTWAGSSQSLKPGFSTSNTPGAVGALDYCVAWQPRFSGISFLNDKTAQTHTGLIATGQNTNATGQTAGITLNSSGNKTLVDCFCVGLFSDGFFMTSLPGCTFTRCKVVSCGGNQGSSSLGGWAFNTIIGCTFNDCESHGNSCGIYMQSGMAGCILNRFLNGTKGTNSVADIALPGSVVYTTGSFLNSTFSSSTFILNPTKMIPGSAMTFSNLNGVSQENITYTATGTIQATGSGLPDTTVRTPGSLAVRLSPSDATTGLAWSFNIPAPASQLINFYGFFLLNATFTGDAAASARVELWLPNSTSADASVTIPKTTNSWQPISVSANNTQTVNGVATVYIYALSATVGAYLFADDFYNAGNGTTNTDVVTGLDTYLNGLIIPIISPQSVNAGAIWTYPISTITSAGVAGKKLNDALSTSKFIGLK